MLRIGGIIGCLTPPPHTVQHPQEGDVKDLGIWAASPLRAAVCRLPGRCLFFVLNVPFAQKHDVWILFVKFILK